MKKARLLLSLLLATMAFSVSACSSITAYDDECPPDGVPGADSRCL